MTNSNGWRTQPMYSFKEVARLAHVSSSTVRNWILGSESERVNIHPLFPSRDEQSATVSFVQLIEIVVTAKLRKAEGVPYIAVKRAHENARKMYKLEYPFAHLQLEAIGGHVIQRIRGEEKGSSLQTLDVPQQWTLPGLVLETIHQIDYERELAARWYPVGKERSIVIDPRVSSGNPTIIRRGVTIEAIHKRWKAGHRIEFIAQDYELDASTVETALQYWEQVAAWSLLCDEDVGTGVPRALRLVDYLARALVELGGAGRPDTEWLTWAGREGYLICSCNKKMLLVPSERDTIIRENVGIVFLTSGEEHPARVLRLLLTKWDDLELLDNSEPRPFAKFLTPNGRLLDSYRHFQL